MSEFIEAILKIFAPDDINKYVSSGLNKSVELYTFVNSIDEKTRHSVIEIATVFPSTENMAQKELASARVIMEYDGTSEALSQVLEFSRNDSELKALGVNEIVSLILEDYVAHFKLYGFKEFDTIVLQRTGRPVLAIVNTSLNDSINPSSPSSVDVSSIKVGSPIYPFRTKKPYDWSGYKGRSAFIDYSDLKQRFHFMAEYKHARLGRVVANIIRVCTMIILFVFLNVLIIASSYYLLQVIKKA